MRTANMKLVLSLPVLAELVLLAQSQAPDANGCPIVEASDLAGPSGLIAESYQSGDGTSSFDVVLEGFNVVCLSAARNKGMWRGVSVVSRYSCNPDTICGSGTMTMQFDFSCVRSNEGNNKWQLEVYSVVGSTLRSTPLQPVLTTPLRTNCSICASQEVVEAVGVRDELAVDNVTHCVGKYSCRFACLRQRRESYITSCVICNCMLHHNIRLICKY